MRIPDSDPKSKTNANTGEGSLEGGLPRSAEDPSIHLTSGTDLVRKVDAEVDWP